MTAHTARGERLRRTAAEAGSQRPGTCRLMPVFRHLSPPTPVLRPPADRVFLMLVPSRRPSYVETIGEAASGSLVSSAAGSPVPPDTRATSLARQQVAVGICNAACTRCARERLLCSHCVRVKRSFRPL